ncbi:hypothetical protein H9649_05370 [Sporosarcina sp. Sa2YVA2]|uniref:Uncharacterized protein n=1 Tax=Sporosarcina quadrami TaxID=2762234 RepID=A0ABR8U873_9BACL|nr:hypothetical protein [Sporosarcina quadrami]MBD7984000.1 hypothetical protein [Sporosarcina quadrami]
MEMRILSETLMNYWSANMKNNEEVLYVCNECQEIHVDETNCCEIEYGWENEALRL